MKRSFMRKLSDHNLWLWAGPRRGAARSAFWKAYPQPHTAPHPQSSFHWGSPHQQRPCI